MIFDHALGPGLCGVIDSIQLIEMWPETPDMPVLQSYAYAAHLSEAFRKFWEGSVREDHSAY